MDLDLAAQIDSLTAVIYTLAIVVVLLCAYIVRLPADEIPASDPTCPLHKTPRSKCKPEWHKPEDE